MTSRLFHDDEDQEAFGHWDEEYKVKIDAIKSHEGYSFDLDSSHMRMSNRQGVPHLNDAACRRLGELLHSSSSWNGFSAHRMGLTGNRVQALFQIWESYEPRGHVISSIRTLNLDTNPSIRWGVFSPNQMRLIRAGNFNEDPSKVGTNKMVALASFLSNNHKLRELSLFQVGMDLEGARNLAASLSTQHSLKMLELGANFLGDEGVTVLTKSLKSVKTLETLWLSQNRISHFASIAPLFEADGLRSIKVLGLSHNNIGDDFLQEMGPVLCKRAPAMEYLALGGKNQFTEDALTNFLLEVMLCTSGNIGDAICANHSLKDLWKVTDFDNEVQVVKNLLNINKLKRISPAEKARQKISEHYFAATPLKQEVLTIDIKLMPHVLSVIARNTPITQLTTRKTPTVTDARRYKILYNVLRNWNMPSLFYHPSPDRVRIQALEKENEQLKGENGALKRKLDAYDEIGSENKRLRDELRRLKEGFPQN